MGAFPTIRGLGATEWVQYREVRFRALAESPDAFGSTLAAEQEWSAELWAARLASAAVSGQDCSLIAEHGSAAIGLVWAKVDPADEAAVDLFQMWVAPEYRGRGVGGMLLQEAIAWARRFGARKVRLCVACGDTAAVRLYTRAGFEVVGAPAPLRPGSDVLAQSMQRMLDDVPT